MDMDGVNVGVGDEVDVHFPSKIKVYQKVKD